MPAPDPAVDRRYLVASIWASGSLGVLGIVWGIAIQSQMVLLDGAYAIVGIVLSWMLLRASSAARRGPSSRYPYGFEAVAPTAVGVQGLVLLATLLYAMYEALLALRSGGTEVSAAWAMAYGVVVTVGSIAFTAWIARGTGTSDILRSEAAAWKLAAWRGVGMVAGFAVLALVERSSWSDLGPYVDPAMVLVSCAALVGTPLQMIRATSIELLEGAPPDDVQRPILDALTTVTAEFRLDAPDVSISKVGPKVYVEVVARADGSMTIREEQAARDRLEHLLETIPYDVWLTLELQPRTRP